VSEELKALKSIENKLDQLLKWTRFAGMQQLRTILNQNLRNDIEMLTYELSDGTCGTRDIAKLVGFKSHATVVAYWKKWSKIGIVESSPQFQGRYQRICSLEEVGLTVPPMQTSTTPVETEKEGEGEDK
jgi:hypothetical protein